ncbi:MAG: oligosaccharide flippase family protein [Leptospiraceae bacterium]|nr:oligosaccharide flippase family protein [Leptospiraceae bacterium]MCK6381702.1 oligosaccharide flippase family protein [Leptospiraceae bacterium]NUM42064.1 oligosaccharide flippase family protein [Leptospiraceae bacterium]
MTIAQIKSNFLSITKSGFFKSSMFVAVSKVFSSLCNLVFMIYAVNLLTKSENGHFQYYLGFVPVILAITEFGLPSALVKFLAPATENKKIIGMILSSSLLIKTISFLFLLFLGLVFFLSFSEDPLIIFILVVGGLGTSFLSYFESVFISFGDYTSLALWNPLGNLIRLVALYITNYFTVGILGYVDILAIFSLSPIFILVLFFFVFDRKKLNWGASKEDIQKGTKELALFNSWAFLASIFAIVSDRLEIFFISKYHPPEAIAVYGTALQLFSGFGIILSTLNSVIYPGLAKLIDTEDFKKYLLKSATVAFIFAIFLSPGFFLAEWILDLLFAGKYSDSIVVFKILYPNYLLQLVFAPFGIALFAMGKPKILAILAFIRLFAGVILDNILIPEFGVTGAGLSFFLGQIISWLVLAGYFWATFWRE